MTSAAELLFTGGRVLLPGGRFAEALGTRGGLIIAAGAEAEVRRELGPRPEAVDLAGGLLVPGFQDAHVHPVAGGIERLRCDLSPVRTLPGYERLLRAYVESHPEREWVTGGGWSMEVFPGGTPTRQALDAIVPDRPVFLFNRDHHGAWVNSAALARAGITAATPDPPDGRIERDAAGEPSGTLHEGAMTLVDRLTPRVTDRDIHLGLLEGQAYLHSLGVTAWVDAIVGRSAVGDLDSFPIYLAAAESGALTARVVGSLWWDREGDESQIPGLVDRRARAATGRFTAPTVKIMQDGVCENFTAAMLEPYLGTSGTPTRNRGLSFVDPERLPGYVTSLEREGFQVHFHTIGDRAVREVLDAIEAARRANGPSDLRHHLAHIQVIHPDDIPRFAGLGAVANGQPLWAYMEAQMRDLTIPFLGEPRWRWQYPFAALVGSGARLAFGSDWPVSSPNPLLGIHVAVNRTPPPGEAGESEPLLPEQSIDLATAITAYTSGSAYVSHRETDSGSLEPGKLADLAILDRDPFNLPAPEIGTARVVATFVEGVEVYRSA